MWLRLAMEGRQMEFQSEAHRSNRRQPRRDKCLRAAARKVKAVFTVVVRHQNSVERYATGRGEPVQCPLRASHDKFPFRSPLPPESGGNPTGYSFSDAIPRFKLETPGSWRKLHGEAAFNWMFPRTRNVWINEASSSFYHGKWRQRSGVIVKGVLRPRTVSTRLVN